MPLELRFDSPDFDQAFRALLSRKVEHDPDIYRQVAAIVNDVRLRGDQALVEYSRRFDRFELTADTMRIPRESIDAAADAVDTVKQMALRKAAERIRAYHQRQFPENFEFIDDEGVFLGSRWRPIESAGLYVPGGTAAYPSSVLMNAIPAKVAGVGRLVMVVPTPDNRLNPLVLAAAREAGVDEIYRVGGAQAIAALAYGTHSIRPVDKIVGPGNAYVAMAKRQVFGTVGIDMIAGPSEILVVADANSDPAWIAADLMSQAEHDVKAQAILVTDDATFAEAVIQAVERCLEVLPRADIARRSWNDYGAVILVRDLAEQAPALIDAVAPEHLELSMEKPERLAAQVRHAGAIFLGRYTPEAIGDYVGGPNHVLPTAQSARFSSGLGVLDFMKRTSLLGCSKDALRRIGGEALTLAEAEGFHAHGLSVAVRMGLGED